MIRFLVVVAAISATMLWFSRKLVATPPTWDIEIVAFLALTTSLVYFLLQEPRKVSPEKFTQLYLLSITVKLVASCVFVIAFILSDREGADANVVLFMCGYVSFTAAEVIFLVLGRSAK